MISFDKSLIGVTLRIQWSLQCVRVSANIINNDFKSCLFWFQFMNAKWFKFTVEKHHHSKLPQVFPFNGRHWLRAGKEVAIYSLFLKTLNQEIFKRLSSICLIYMKVWYNEKIWFRMAETPLKLVTGCNPNDLAIWTVGCCFDYSTPCTKVLCKTGHL